MVLLSHEKYEEEYSVPVQYKQLYEAFLTLQARHVDSVAQQALVGPLRWETWSSDSLV